MKKPARHEEESEVLERKLPCPDQGGCGSSDAFHTFTDGHGYCFSCDKYFKPGSFPDGEWTGETSDGGGRERSKVSDEVSELIAQGTHRALTSWGISQETCAAWDYRTMVTAKGEGRHIAVYRDRVGTIVDAKVRETGTNYDRKDFFWASGHAPKGLIYGAHKLGKGGPKIIIASGEKDCLTISQLWGNKFPVVSAANGEKGLKDFAPYLADLSRYDQIVIAQDMDEPGQRKALQLAAMFPAGKVFLTRFPEKDANEVLLKHGPDRLIREIHNAVPYRPDGILDADEIDGELLNPTKWGLSLPYDFLYKWTYGMRPGEVWVIGAGTGIGKSDFGSEIIAHLIKPKSDGGEEVPVAVFNYEAAALGSLKLALGKLWDKRFNIPDPEDGSPNLYWTHEDMEAARLYRREKCAKLFINDHKGAVDWDSVKERLRYLKHAAGIQVGFVDPVAALVAQEDDDRKALDRLFAESKGLAEELGITIVFFSHLTRPKDGKSHEEGGRVALNHFRGSGAIVMWASFVFGIERNQQAEDEEERKDTTIRVLKDRFTGDSTGRTRTLIYDVMTGRLEEKDSPLDPQPSQTAEAPSNL